MDYPCKDCSIRKDYAKLFDAHIDGDDCPYECEKYNEYIKSKDEAKQE